MPLFEGRIAALCFTTVAEVYFGAYKAAWGQRKMRALEAGMDPYLILPYDREIAQHWARSKAALESAGNSLGANDLWIAATALRHGVPLATNNRRHFERVAGLQVLPSADGATQ